MAEAGRSVTSSTLSRGDLVLKGRAANARAAKARHEQQRRRRAEARAAAGPGSAASDRELEAIDGEIARLKQVARDRAAAAAALVEARRAKAADWAHAHTAAVARHKGSVASGALDRPGRPRVGAHPEGRHPLPVSAPFAYRAQDLFKTFNDDERW